jgi:hypothetical protein
LIVSGSIDNKDIAGTVRNHPARPMVSYEARQFDGGYDCTVICGPSKIERRMWGPSPWSLIDTLIVEIWNAAAALEAEQPRWDSNRKYVKPLPRKRGDRPKYTPPPES